MGKISKEERDRVFRRYNELFIHRDIEIVIDIDEAAEIALETEGYQSAEALAQALEAIDRAIDYDNECVALEITMEELAADGDPSAISLLLNEEVIMFRESRAARVKEFERIRDILTAHKKPTA